MYASVLVELTVVAVVALTVGGASEPEWQWSTADAACNPATYLRVGGDVCQRELFDPPPPLTAANATKPACDWSLSFHGCESELAAGATPPPPSRNYYLMGNSGGSQTSPAGAADPQILNCAAAQISNRPPSLTAVTRHYAFALHDALRRPSEPALEPSNAVLQRAEAEANLAAKLNSQKACKTVRECAAQQRAKAEFTKARHSVPNLVG